MDALGQLKSGIKKMPDKLEIENQKDIELKRQLGEIIWPIDYGSVKIQILAGKPVFITVERKLKLD